MKILLLLPLLLVLFSSSFAQNNPLGPASVTEMARRIVKALQPARGERVILRFDPEVMPALKDTLRKMFEESGAVVETLAYGPAPDLEDRLKNADIYIWLPTKPDAITAPDQAELLGRWLDSGKGRQVHFHWGDGTRGVDGLTGAHSAAYDRVYMEALDIDYQALNRKMDEIVSKMRASEVNVTTPAGTNLTFKVGDRPFCKQNGDASKKRMAEARVRIDREIELPAGALRVAPLEESVNGVMVLPWARMHNVEIKDIRVEISKGVVTKVSSRDHEEDLQRYFNSGKGLKLFREFALGLNPKLVTPGGEKWVAYYGYGDGVVRLGLGDNSELGGMARGLPVRWLFFTDATVRIGNEVLVRNGRLVK